jgi:8-oxo-dGTP pyrophosphatase MutT (NUDIX family)
MDLTEVERRLTAALVVQLPGEAAHALLAPRPRRGWRPGKVPAGLRAAAGLVLLYPDGDEQVRLVLTLRPSGLARHGGQVSLPGGAVEAGESVEDAALREACEEIGADPGGIRVLGRLTPLHVPVSGFVIHPVVAVAGRPFVLKRRDGEVEEILEVRLRDLVSRAALCEENRIFEGREHRVPFFALLGHKVWGATAMILSELVSLLGEAGTAG